MNAADIMTRDVVTVSPDTDIASVVRLLLDHDISAVPVVDDKRLVGLISEGDLLGRAPAHGPRAWWLHLFNDPAAGLQDVAKARGLKARDVMVTEVVSVPGATPVDRVADLMRRQRLKHVPVVDDGKVVGIVSRIDFLAAMVGGGSVDELC